MTLKYCGILCVFWAVAVQLSAQKDYDSIMAENQKYREETNQAFSNSTSSPLEDRDIEVFEGLPFYDIDTSFYVLARFERARKARRFKMKTTTDRKPKYDVYGRAYFTLNGQEYVLAIYQSHELREQEKYKDYLFLPFMDLSNGEGTYPGGRFIDLKIPEGDEIIIDFNKAYNPYCAYNDKYSCPIPPKENFLEVKVLAGVKYKDKH